VPKHEAGPQLWLRICARLSLWVHGTSADPRERHRGRRRGMKTWCRLKYKISSTTTNLRSCRCSGGCARGYIPSSAALQSLLLLPHTRLVALMRLSIGCWIKSGSLAKGFLSISQCRLNRDNKRGIEAGPNSSTAAIFVNQVNREALGEESRVMSPGFLVNIVINVISRLRVCGLGFQDGSRFSGHLPEVPRKEWR
jgi:hypothetical protein